MKAIMKDGTEYEIDTKCLFEDQYNTVPAPGENEGKRIFDGRIARIIDDVRPGLGRCRYCGTIVKKGEEEKHFVERESTPCEKCWWWQKRLVEELKATPIVNKIVNEDGTETIEEVRHITQKWKFGCQYKGMKSDCAGKECRMLGINWFDEKTCFFIAYPNGFNPVCKTSDLDDRFEKYQFSAEYDKKIGSYRFSASIKDGDVEYWRISNCRRHYAFRYESGIWYTLDTQFGWKRRKGLEGIPADVIEHVIKIIQEVTGNDALVASDA